MTYHQGFMSAPGQETTSDAQRRIRILIVEDEALEAFLLKNCFTLEGFHVCEMASRGSEALRIAAQSKPDVIIMDNGLAGNMNGVETAHHIRSFSSVPILFLTGYLSEEIKNQVRLLAPAASLVKPARIPEVLAQIKDLMNQE